MNYLKQNYSNFILILAALGILFFGIWDDFYTHIFNFEFISVMFQVSAVAGWAMIARLLAGIVVICAVIMGTFGLAGLAKSTRFAQILVIIVFVVYAFYIALSLLSGNPVVWSFIACLVYLAILSALVWITPCKSEYSNFK